ncbi:hypothetical protein H6F41_16155 [Pseudanabaena sp. FACHB-723]|uniref:Uncharacterized protein n=1 Tax=Pseudanabaena mucicola FACHB-723 TaxID=2692860 RepID=A0ABR8A0D8_9CYAN|nr:hypothetical protein [Pseudanabaena mucicola FACHB-723]
MLPNKNDNSYSFYNKNSRSQITLIITKILEFVNLKLVETLSQQIFSNMTVATVTSATFE